MKKSIFFIIISIFLLSCGKIEDLISIETVETNTLGNKKDSKKIEKKDNNKSKYYYEETISIVGNFNIEEISTEDEKVYPYFLHLDKPIKVVPKDGEEAYNDPETNVTKIQLALDKEKIEYLKSENAYGKTIKITGELFHSHTMYHYTEVLMSVSKVEIVN